jgi:serine/threonine protein kinase
MEFVDGEPLDRLIRRSNKLEVKLALEIATQVAGGLAAIHEQNLVHRDIKPSNVIVKLKGDSSIAKIIDLGLAKGVAEAQPENSDFDSRKFRWHARARQPGAICGGQRRYPFRSVFAGYNTLGDADW